ncbi:NAD(P)-dependent dehydrogenase (short-subunit alcohol dehydrogenase family) [Actinocorallia herbida]|uniref:NAD(P)-dependent dehydrogenase (Short-subunit alcohol dehydrogenase family) n=1 Tax=Actinocorallia herbida TaxID=58109 RepID=A0A3N1D6D1_9ACTN|nr:oxidoreductase [Actinocorallia herbida]ROO89019.1 NAD(P)-dependent dehydrogenase (short-subunit alcohol dehydrogenase family) [Actinocorallia herbida]
MGWTAADIPDLAGRRVIVTGANSGIGLKTALELARHGADTVLACRSAERGEAALAGIAKAVPGARVSLGIVDLADLSSVRAFADAQVKEPLDVLINNGGVMAIPRAVTADGFERQFGTNHLGHFALTGLLLPALLRREGGRVVTVTSLMSNAARSIDFTDLQGERNYSKWLAYGRAKLANLVFAKELGRRVPGVASLAAHPGYADTELTASSAKSSGSRAEAVTYTLGRVLAQSGAAGALPTLRAATDPAARGGECYGPRLLARGAPVRTALHPRGDDPEHGRRLWEASEELTGVHYP